MAGEGGGITYPACFDSLQQFAAWRELADISRASSYCVDCTPAHQSAMLGQGRCQSPLTMFRICGVGPNRGIRGVAPRGAAIAAGMARNVKGKSGAPRRLMLDKSVGQDTIVTTNETSGTRSLKIPELAIPVFLKNPA